MKLTTIPIAINIEIEEKDYGAGEPKYLCISCPDYSVAVEKHIRPGTLPVCIVEVAQMLSKRLTPERITYEISRHLGGS